MANNPYDGISSVTTEVAPPAYDSISSIQPSSSKIGDLGERYKRGIGTAFSQSLRGLGNIIRTGALGVETAIERANDPMVNELPIVGPDGELVSVTRPETSEETSARIKKSMRQIESQSKYDPSVLLENASRDLQARTNIASKVDPLRDRELSSRAMDLAAPIVPVLASGQAAPYVLATQMGGGAIQQGEAEGKTPDELQRAGTINSIGGLILGKAPIPFLNRAGAAIDQSVVPIQNTLLRESARRTGRAAAGAVLGGATNAAGDIGLQLADTDKVDWNRALQNAAIGGGAGIALSGAARRTTVPEVAPRSEPVVLAERQPLQLEERVAPTSADFAAEEQAALEAQKQLLDQRSIRDQIREQIQNEYAKRSPQGAQALRDRLAYEEAQANRNADIEANKAQIADPAADLQNAIESNRLSAPEQLPTETLPDQARRQINELDAQKATEIQAQLSPQASRMRDEYGRISSEVFLDPRIRAAGGAVGGAAYGITQGDTPEERLRNALLYGAGGAVAASAGLGRVIRALEPTTVPKPRGQPLPPNSRATVQEYVGLDNVPKKTVQIDLIDETGKNTGSHSPEALRAAGFDVPDFTNVPQGQYDTASLKEIPSPLANVQQGEGQLVVPPALYVGRQELPPGAAERGITGESFKLTEAIPGHPAGSNVSRPTLEAAGYHVPETPDFLAGTREPFPVSDLIQEPSTQTSNATQTRQVEGNNPGEYPQAGGGALPPEAGGGNSVQRSGNVPPQGPQGPVNTPGGNAPQLPGRNPVPADLAEAGLGGKLLDLKTNLVDYTAPIETLFRDFQNEYGYEVRPRDRITNMISRAINARSIAGQFLRDSGYFQLLRDVPDLKEFDRYITDLHALDVDTIGGKQTGVDLVKAQANVAANQQLMQPYVDRLRDFSRQILAKGVEYGLIPAERAAYWEEKYPNYVPLKRVFEESEIPTRGFGGGRGVTNLGSQSVFQKMIGSNRPIIEPTGSFITKVEDLFAQGERNKAAQTLASYRDLPGWDQLLHEVKSSSNAPHTFTYLEDGVKKTIAAPKEIAEAAKALNVHQLGILGRVLAYPMRIFKAGTTGLEPSFAARNLIRDQFTAAIATNDLPATVKNFLPAVMEAIGHDLPPEIQSRLPASVGSQYHELARQGGLFTSFDVNRASPATTAEAIRSGRSSKDRALYLVKNPGEMFRAFENVIGRPEEATRIQQFMAQFQSDIKKGLQPEDALVNATEAARQVTADFSRHGNFGPVMRAFQPYLTAGFAGSRALVRAFRRDPMGTTVKTATVLLLPEVLATAWNLSDEKRKEAYNDISPYEKENFFVIMPPQPVQDERGRWNAIKIPMPPGYSNLSRFVRRPMEQWAGLDPVGFGEMAQAAVGTVSPVEPSKQGMLSNIALQPVKPLAEIGLNKDFFTGRDIIPADLIDKVPEYQYDKKTSGTSVWLGQHLGISPLQIDHAIKGYFGRGGTELQNILDRSVASVSGNPDFQVGGQSIGESFERSFISAQGGQNLNRFYQAYQDTTSALNTYVKLKKEQRTDEAEKFYTDNEDRIKAGIRMEALRHSLQLLTQKQRTAEEEGDTEAIKEIRQQKTDIAKQAMEEYRDQLSQ